MLVYYYVEIIPWFLVIDKIAGRGKHVEMNDDYSSAGVQISFVSGVAVLAGTSGPFAEDPPVPAAYRQSGWWARTGETTFAAPRPCRKPHLGSRYVRV